MKLIIPSRITTAASCLILLLTITYLLFGWVQMEGITFQNPIRFPFGAPFMGLFVAIAVPLELSTAYDVFLSYNMEFNYSVPENETEYDYPPIISRDFPLDRKSVYEAIVYKLESHGFSGKACLLRTICEASEYSMKHNGLLADLFHVVFTPSTSRSEGLKVYEAAEQYGIKYQHCKKYCKKCVVSVLGIISFIDKVFQ